MMISWISLFVGLVLGFILGALADTRSKTKSKWDDLIHRWIEDTGVGEVVHVSFGVYRDSVDDDDDEDEEEYPKPKAPYIRGLN